MDDRLYPVCELTAEQKKAFNKLKKAYKGCEEAGIYFANNYGNLMAFDNKLVAGYGDDSISPGGEYAVRLTYGCPADSIKVANEWADDTHTLGLTKKGMKLYLQEEEA